MRNRTDRQGEMRARRPTYANVVSTLALFLALGGTSYAVARNSVGTRELKPDAVTSAKVKDHSLGSRDLESSALLAGPRGARGSEGPPGPKGDKGAVGPTGPSQVIHAFRDGAVSLADAPEFKDILTLDNVPAGTYWVIGSSDGVFTAAGAKTYFRCFLVFNGNPTSDVAGAVGAGAGAAEVMPISISGTAVFDGTGSIRLRCGHDAPLAAGGNPRFEVSRLTAIRTEALDLRPAGG